MYSLDDILAMAEQRAEEAIRPELRKKRFSKIFADLKKYEQIVANQYAHGLKCAAWDALVSTYPESIGVADYDVDAFLVQLGIPQMTYTDPTGLMWVTDGNIASKAMNWGYAMNWVNKLNYKGFRDWRLPTRLEFEYFLKLGGDNSSNWLIANGFNNVQPTYYWTSSPDPYNNIIFNSDKDKKAYFINMFDSKLSDFISVNNSFFAWPVRDEK